MGGPLMVKSMGPDPCPLLLKSGPDFVTTVISFVFVSICSVLYNYSAATVTNESL